MEKKELIEFAQCELFKFCSCGDIEENIKYIHSLLTNIQNDSYNSPLSKEEQLIFHFLDSFELIEHGTSIRFPWLTDKGKGFLWILNKIVNTQE